MLDQLLTTILKEILNFLVKHKSFKDLSESEQRKLIQNLELPESIKIYLLEATEKDIYKDLSSLINYLTTGKQEIFKLKGKLFNALTEFMINELGHYADQNQLEIKYQGSFGVNLNELFKIDSIQEISMEIESFIKLIKPSEYVLIQSPKSIDSKLKHEIRTELNKDYPNSFPRFTVNKNLIGGIRVFVNGKTTDLSWLSKINNLTTINNI
ncbi:hypothetical protein GF376_04095 [Candidatus Peregrinibacteria bacterium]|nr:hypothetical protein [Candidatus Peregrinibacteria bacterium]